MSPLLLRAAAARAARSARAFDALDAWLFATADATAALYAWRDAPAEGGARAEAYAVYRAALEREQTAADALHRDLAASTTAASAARGGLRR